MNMEDDVMRRIIRKWINLVETVCWVTAELIGQVNDSNVESFLWNLSFGDEIVWDGEGWLLVADLKRLEIERKLRTDSLTPL